MAQDAEDVDQPDKPKRPKRETIEVEVDGKQLTLSNQAKVLYPQAGFTKGQVVDYYRRIAPVLVPHLTNRPLTLKRYPNGVDGMFFFEKNATKGRPEWVKTVGVWGFGRGSELQFILCNDTPTLRPGPLPQARAVVGQQRDIRAGLAAIGEEIAAHNDISVLVLVDGGAEGREALELVHAGPGVIIFGQPGNSAQLSGSSLQTASLSPRVPTAKIPLDVYSIAMMALRTDPLSGSSKKQRSTPESGSVIVIGGASASATSPSASSTTTLNFRCAPLNFADRTS